jgi:hypothetical protein
MTLFLQAAALSLFGLFSLLTLGLALILRLRPHLRGIELAAYGAACGVLALGVLGLIVALGIFPPRWAGTGGLIAGDAAALFFLTRRHGEALASLIGERTSVSGLLGVLIAPLLALAIALTPISMPDPLVDGPYVFKNHNLHVRIQHIVADFPADNVLPHTVSEFFLRHISFKDERPILPGQEVSNRPILMSLAVMPFRDMIDPPPMQEGRLQRFDYVNTSWPNVEPLADDSSFLQFLSIAVTLNALIMLGAALMMERFSVAPRLRPFVMAVLVTSPYFLSQILFTWPKCLGALFLMLALNSIQQKKDARETGIWTACAYWSHPYALIFTISLTIYFYVASQGKVFRDRARTAGRFLLAWGLCVLPWFLWSRVWLHIPSNLVTQNALIHEHLYNMIWARLFNVFQLITPAMFESYPYNGEKFFADSIISLPGALGLLLFIPAYAALTAAWRGDKLVPFFYVILPAILIVMVFSAPNIPAVHGFQAIGPVMIAMGMRWLQDKGVSIPALQRLLTAQFLIGVTIWTVRMIALHRHAVT